LIQAAVRGTEVRWQQGEQAEAAGRITAGMLGSSRRIKRKEEEKAALGLQSWLKGISIKRRGLVRSWFEVISSTSRIQGLINGRSARIRTRLLLWEAEVSSAQQIKGAFVGLRMRRRNVQQTTAYEHMWGAMMGSATRRRSVAQDEAAFIIQSGIIGSQARGRAQSMKRALLSLTLKQDLDRYERDGGPS